MPGCSKKALDRSLPVLERLKFLSIFSTNLDEFFMVRVAGLQEQLETNPDSLSPDGLTPATQLKLYPNALRPLLKLQTDCLLSEILPALRDLEIQLVELSDLSSGEEATLEQFFVERVFPILTPLAVDPGHPFPYISNISLNLGVLLRPCSAPAEEEPRFARVKIPGNVPRLIRVNETEQVRLARPSVSRAHSIAVSRVAPSWNASHSALRAMPTSKSKRMKPKTF